VRRVTPGPRDAWRPPARPPPGGVSAYPCRVTSRALIALALVLAGAGCPAAPPPQQQTLSSEPEFAEIVHAWRVDAHLLGRHTSLTDADAAAHHGRTVSITRTGYTSPWHGTCEEYGQIRSVRRLAEITAELGMDRQRVLALGFTDPVAEYRLACADFEHRSTSLTLFVSKARALTCFSGVCYVLAR
jgi:hypothetical protein